jgi:hypothetical protein
VSTPSPSPTPPIDFPPPLRRSSPVSPMLLVSLLPLHSRSSSSLCVAARAHRGGRDAVGYGSEEAEVHTRWSLARRRRGRGGCSVVVGGPWEIDVPSRKQHVHRVHGEEEDLTSVWTIGRSCEWRRATEGYQSWGRWPGRRLFLSNSVGIRRKNGPRGKSCCAARSCMGQLGNRNRCDGSPPPVTTCVRPHRSSTCRPPTRTSASV